MTETTKRASPSVIARVLPLLGLCAAITVNAASIVLGYWIFRACWFRHRVLRLRRSGAAGMRRASSRVSKLVAMRRPGSLLEIHVGERLAVVVLDDEAGGICLLNVPRRREPANGHRLECANHDNKPNHDTDRR